MASKKQPTPKSPLERAIASRERGIARMEKHKEEIRREANERIAAIDRAIYEKHVLLDALRRGQLAS
jgi:hypothetical protein